MIVCFFFVFFFLGRVWVEQTRGKSVARVLVTRVIEMLVTHVIEHFGDACDMRPLTFKRTELTPNRREAP